MSFRNIFILLLLFNNSSRDVLLQGTHDASLPRVDAVIVERKAADQPDDILQGHAIAQHTADELGIIPVLLVKLLAETFDGNLVATLVLELEVVALDSLQFTVYRLLFTVYRKFLPKHS